MKREESSENAFLSMRSVLDCAARKRYFESFIWDVFRGRYEKSTGDYFYEKSGVEQFLIEILFCIP